MKSLENFHHEWRVYDLILAYDFGYTTVLVTFVSSINFFGETNSSITIYINMNLQIIFIFFLYPKNKIANKLQISAWFIHKYCFWW